MSIARNPHYRFSGFEPLEVRTLMSTYFIAPNGSDSASGSSAAPFGSFSRAYDAMQGGDTLIVKNGTYDQQQVFTRAVRPPSGSANAYTIVKAETPGGAVVDGKGNMSPVFMDGNPYSPISYVQIDGMVFRHQASGASLYDVDHIKFTQDGFEDAADGNSMTFVAGRYSSYILVEDSFAWGSGRYKFATYHADHVVFRRTVARFDRAVSTPDPIAVYAIYSSDRVELQNTIAIDADHPEYWLNVAEYSGAYSIPSTDGPSTHIDITGAIALNVDMQFGTLSKDLNDIHISNSVGWHLREGVLARDSADYSHMTLGDIYGPSRQTQTVGLNWVQGDDSNNTTSLNNSLLLNIKGTALTNWNSEDYNDFFGNNSNRNQYTANGSHSISSNPNLKYVLSTQGASSAIVGKGSDGSDIGANIIKRIGVSGTLWGEPGYNSVTGQDLWPWPNQDIIATFMRSYSYQNLSGNRGFAATGQTLTNYVWNYLGNGNPYSGGSYNPTQTPTQNPAPTPIPDPPIITQSVPTTQTVPFAVAITAAQFRQDQSGTALVYQFNADVFASLNLPDASIVNLSTGTTYQPTSWTWDSAAKQATFKLQSALPNGSYRATFRAGGVWDSSGNTLANTHTMDFSVAAPTDPAPSPTNTRLAYRVIRRPRRFW